MIKKTSKEYIMYSKANKKAIGFYKKINKENKTWH
jgi:hypothetical protein